MNNYLKKDINLFACVGRERGIGAVDLERSIKKCLLVFAVIFGVVLVACLGTNQIKKSKIEKLNNDIQALQADLKEIEQYKLEAEQLQKEIDNFNSAIVEFESSPRLTTDDIKNVARAMPAGVTLKSFNYNGNAINLEVVGNSELVIADYANSLRNSVTVDKTSTEGWNKKNFKDVKYTGVSKNDALYTGSITVILNDIVVETTTEAATETTTAAAAQ